jgi:hypothetical protein
MRSLIATLSLIVCVSAASILDAELNTHWEQYKQTHKKLYNNGEEEDLR